MNHQADNWKWAQHDVHDTLSCKMIDSEQAAFIKSQQEINSRLGEIAAQYLRKGSKTTKVAITSRRKESSNSITT